METEGFGGMEGVKRGDLCGARGEVHHRTGVRALVVARKPGNAGGAKGCRKVET